MSGPFYCEALPYEADAAHYFAAISDLPWVAWLDSGGMGRFDILTAAPCRTIKASCSDPFAALRRELGEPVSPVDDVPFAGGALGCLGYPDRLDMQDMSIGIYDWALVLDHERKTARLVSHRRHAETPALLEQVLQRLRAEPAELSDTFRVESEIRCNFTKERYLDAFSRVQEYLHSGDCYQVNLAQRFTAAARGDARAAYLKLRRMSPAPYSAYLGFPHVKILCASPERFIGVRERRVETRPIKGTRARDGDPLRDAQLAEDLACHPKDRAENLMIVDLLRNDLGKHCNPGSVRVPELFKVESYSNVHHLVSVVQGELEDGLDALDMLQGCFPGGSITGAPKLRAMQIIEELEPDPRGMYCGTIFYAGFDRNMDSNIAIRTLVYRGDEISCWAGGGLVADSKPEEEYQETLDKARAMLDLLQGYRGKQAD